MKKNIKNTLWVGGAIVGITVQSLPKISDIPSIKYVFTAHHGFSNDYRKVFENFRKVP